MIEERLRTGLHDHVAGLDPDLETTLDSIVSRARRRRRTVQVGLLAAVSAACVAAVLLIGPDGVLRSEDPPHPVEQPKHSGEVVALHAGVGELFAPAPIEPGRYLVDFLDAGAGTSAVVSVPEGWGQDDDVALAAGPAVLSNVRRLELWTVASVPPDCGNPARALGPTARDLVDFVRTWEPVNVSSVRRVELDGYAGYLLTLAGPPTRGTHCEDTRIWSSTHRSMGLAKGWTGLVWVMDVDGQRLVVSASYGPAVTSEQIGELEDMVQSLTFVTGEE